MEPLFQSAKLKIERANTHIKELDSEIAKFCEQNRDAIWTHGDPRAGTGVIGIRPFKAPPIFNIILGDIAHNLRSALDHVTGEITLKRGGDITKSKFPMSVVPEEFERFVTLKIEPYDASIAAVLRTEVKAANEMNGLLDGINRLNNTDKHRAIVVTVTKVGIAASGITLGRSRIGRIEAVNCGAMISNFSGLPMQFQQEPHPVISVVFGTGEAFEGKPVVQTLEEASKFTSYVVDLCARNATLR